MTSKTKSSVALLIVGVLIFYVLFTGSVVPVNAQGLGLLPFGGFVTVSLFCVCSENYLLTLTGPVGGQFIYQFTPQFSFYMLPSPLVWALGLYEPGGECTTPPPLCPVVGAPLGTITSTVGTSLVE